MANPKLSAGDLAPDFSLEADGGETISLADLQGHRTVLYFYPKDDTPGCTTEACDFRDHMGRIESQLGIRVIGVSPDSVASHQKFKTKNEIPFTLLSDPDGEVCNLYGVLKEKNLYGKKRIGIERSTFIVDEAGKIAAVYRGVKVSGHVGELLDAL